MDTESVILTVIGDDKPGLVERLATIVADHHGHWLESRMARLAGQFAGILQVEVAAAHREALVQALNRVHEGSLQVTASRLGASEADAAMSQRVRLDLVGTDRPGIVQQISRVIAACGVNVEEIETTAESAPMSGETLFKATASLQVPSGVALAKLQEDLEEVSQDLMVDITLS